MHGLSSINIVNLAQLTELIGNFFSQNMACECRIPYFRKTLSKPFSSGDVDKIMIWCFYTSMLQSAVHSFAPDLWLDYIAKQTHDIQIFGHGGTHRVYMPLIEGINQQVVRRFSEEFMRDWITDFDHNLGKDKTAIIVQRLKKDTMYLNALGENVRPYADL